MYDAIVYKAVDGMSNDCLACIIREQLRDQQYLSSQVDQNILTMADANYIRHHWRQPRPKR